MKQDYPHLSIKNLCELFGKTRHAYYDRQWHKENQYLKEDIVVQLVLEIREKLPRIGTRKLHHMLSQKLEQHNITIGRDHLFDLLSCHKLLIRNRRRTVITTNSRHWMRKYSNLIEEMEILWPEQLWVSDITYIRLAHDYAYLSLITDAYSRKIVGFNLHSDLSSQGCISALQMALDNRCHSQRLLIHHSDRGSQYCCKEYVELLNQNRIAISMTENGDPYENALAERVNGIIKSEFKLYNTPLTLQEAKQLVSKSIHHYNTLRPHASCDFFTPQQAHEMSGKLKKRW